MKKWAILAPLLILAGALIYFESQDRSTPSATAAFDPAQAPELEIKGAPPDGASSWSGLQIPAAPPDSEAMRERGKEIFKKACAGCHGNEGKGDGLLPRRFDFPSLPADLTQPLRWIKLRTTLPGSPPLPEDLFRTVTRGLPGTAMASYRELPENDRWALVQYIASLSPDYKSTVERIQLPPKPADNEEIRKAGAATFSATCQNCHGAQGLGRETVGNDPATGKPYPGLGFAREGGAKMLGGNSDEDIARSLMAGMSGRSPMMSFRAVFYGTGKLTPEENAEGDRNFWGTVFYTRRLYSHRD